MLAVKPLRHPPWVIHQFVTVYAEIICHVFVVCCAEDVDKTL